VLRKWHERQLFESLESGDAWTDSGQVFTREDGSPLRPGWVSEHFGVLYRRSGQPPVRFHDYACDTDRPACCNAHYLFRRRRGAEVVSETMGHSTSAFTADVYVTVLEELTEAAAVAIEAFVPRKARTEAAE
jgi:hypothetical protein